MVMETPSPQCVGLEFVRQYYTVLNKAPMHLHRFYSHNSLFMHGGPNNANEPTVGQADIHKKILNLNFQDCHAKIRMVDSHATLGNGVVIQVTGELSNNGMLMRRFMQTFVLAPQSPKKYYVHNDIFRYQDEVFSDEEPTDEGNSEPEEDLDNVEESSFSSNSATVNGTSHHHNHHRDRDTSPVVTSAQTHIQSPAQVTPTNTPAPVKIPPSPPVVAPMPIQSEPRPLTPPPPAPPTETEGWTTPNAALTTDDWVEPIEEKISPKKKETPAKPSLPEPIQKTVVTQKNQPPSQKTYANLFKSPGNFSQNSSHSVTSVQPQIQETSQSYSSQSAQSESVNTNRPSSSATGSSTTQSSSSNPRLSRNYHDDDKRRPAVPDCQQVFIGNLPHTIGEDQLKVEFTQYGKILDVRINTGKGKAGSKGPGGHPVPNFGFIAFEDESAVHRCLKARPIYLNGDSRINVEEKKPRGRMDGGGMGGGRPSSGRGGGGMNSGGSSMRGGSQGGRGGGRGSFSRDNSRGGSSSSRGGGGGGSGGYNQRR